MYYTTGIIMWSVALIAGTLAYIAKKRYPVKSSMILPYLYILMGVCFIIQDLHNSNTISSVVLGGIAFLAFGLFQLYKRAMENKPFKRVE
jgi:hypothetical protein